MMHYFLYLDPGSGSYLVQVIAAAVLGIGFYFRSIKNYIKTFFSKSPKKPNDTPPA